MTARAAWSRDCWTSAAPDNEPAERAPFAESAIDSTLVLDDSAIEKPMLGRYRLEARIGREAQASGRLDHRNFSHRLRRGRGA